MSPDAGSSLRCRSLGLVLVGLSCATACQDEPLGLTEPPVTGHSILRDVIVLPQDKVDLLFVVDNSGSMDDKRPWLGRALVELVERLVNPACVDDKGQRFVFPNRSESPV